MYLQSLGVPGSMKGLLHRMAEHIRTLKSLRRCGYGDAIASPSRMLRSL